MNEVKKTENVSIYPLGESAIVMEFGTQIDSETSGLISAICRFLDEYSFEGFVEYVPAYTTVTLFYDIMVSDFQTTRSLLMEMLDEISDPDLEEEIDQVVEIPVLYGGETGRDLPFVAQYNGLTEEKVVSLHASGTYLVHMIGFAPGFPYLGGMDERIAVPRKDSPRALVTAGSVGIAGKQTGIYPIDSPGGWQIIGQTPLNLFDLEREHPALLKAGCKVRFVAIDVLEFDQLKGGSDGN